MARVLIHNPEPRISRWHDPGRPQAVRARLPPIAPAGPLSTESLHPAIHWPHAPSPVNRAQNQRRARACAAPPTSARSRSPSSSSVPPYSKSPSESPRNRVEMTKDRRLRLFYGASRRLLLWANIPANNPTPWLLVTPPPCHRYKDQFSPFALARTKPTSDEQSCNDLVRHDEGRYGGSTYV